MSVQFLTESGRNGHSVVQIVHESNVNRHPIAPQSKGNGHSTVQIVADSNERRQFSLFRKLEGKVAIITGGARGIGEATVRLFARHGARVIIADIEDMAGVKLSTSLGPAVTFKHCDVSKDEDVAEAVNLAVSKYGRLDIMYNNAGILGDQAKRKSIMDFDADEFDRIMNVNVKGVCLGMKHAARVMVPRRTGCIISTASVAGVLGGLGPHSYTASKHAIVGLTKNAACELGKYAIRVNSISPFGVPTAMLINAWKEKYDEEDVKMDARYNRGQDEVQRLEDLVQQLGNLKGPTLTAKDIAEAALYLVSDEAKYVSGHNLVVDGGVTTINNCIEL